MTPNNATTPPLLRPLNSIENTAIDTLLLQNRRLNDDITKTKIQLNDRHAELRVMRVGIEELTKRALKAEHDAAALETESLSLRIAITATTSRAEKAEARVKEQQAEMAEQEVDMLRLIQENMTRII